MATDERSRCVLAIPAGHPYVQRVVPSGWSARPDPTEPWWPHPGLEAAHVAGLGDRVDLVHLHFGYEHRTLAQMGSWLDAMDDAGTPLVVTVHDLRHPHLADNTAHDQHLGLLMARAAAIITLTSGAARDIRRRWGRSATVIGHPPLIGTADGPRPRTVPGLVGLTFKNRPSVADPADVLGPVLAAVSSAGGSVEVRLDAAVEPAWVDTATRMLGGGPGHVVVTDPSSDVQFAAELARLHVAVLPYRHGTHSGWLEACRDVGTRVVAPDTGYYHDQWDEVITYQPDPPARSVTLERAVRHALAEPEPGPPAPAAQSARAVAVTEAHQRVYARVMGDRHP